MRLTVTPLAVLLLFAVAAGAQAARDAATPAHYGATAARSLPNGRQILIRNAAHWCFDDCLRDLNAQFIAAGSASDLDTRCVERLRRPPFVTGP